MRIICTYVYTFEKVPNRIDAFGKRYAVRYFKTCQLLYKYD